MAWFVQCVRVMEMNILGYQAGKCWESRVRYGVVCTVGTGHGNEHLGIPGW